MQARTVCRSLAGSFLRRLTDALPTIVLYVILFFLVLALFGLQFSMILPGCTTLFQLRYKQRNDTRAYIHIFFIPIVLSFLAYAAAQNVVLCVALNLIVPFFLVLWKSSQFNPKGHLGFAMSFVFLELSPPSPGEFWLQEAAVMLCQVALLLALLLTARRYQPADPSLQIPAGLHRLSELLSQIAREGVSRELYAELYDTAHRLHHLGYDRRRLLHIPDPQKNQYHFLALLYQRTSYLISDEGWQDETVQPMFSQALLTLSELTAACERAQTPQDRAALRQRLTDLRSALPIPRGRPQIFYRNVLLILRLFCQEPSTPPAFLLWQRIPWRDVLADFRRRCSTDRFEFRFALQLSAVMTISMTVSFLWDFEHTYWFPLHAFLLLQPSYEDSAHRMVTRPVGTAIGCLLVHLVWPHLAGTPAIFTFSLLMISLMYCCTPGTWVHPIFSTSFALTMAALTLEKSEAIQLRLFYLGMAVVLVLIINRFFFPNRKEQQFRSNLRELCRLQSVYWGVLRHSLRESLDPTVFCELLSQFHMVHHAVHQYVLQLPEETARDYQLLLLTLWSMFSQLEQIECLIQSELVQEEEYAPLDQLAAQAAARIASLSPSLALLKASAIKQEDLRYLLERYLRNGRKLLHAHLIPSK